MRRKLIELAVCFVVVGSALRSLAADEHPPRPHTATLVFMTDFGVKDDSVAICKGVMYSIAPHLRIVDITHDVTPYSILDGARFLYGATPYYPPGTVFVAVIDPGVGSTRKAIVVRSKRGQYFVLPDNGLITLVADRDGIDTVRDITNRAWMVGGRLSSTFHGRDIFSPVGAHLARGDDWRQIGPELAVVDLVRLDWREAAIDEHGLNAEVIATDGPFGNLVTNASAEEFFRLGYRRGENVTLKLGDREVTMPFVRTFSDVPLDKPLLYIDSRGRVSLAINQGNFAAAYDMKPPVALFIPKAKN